MGFRQHWSIEAFHVAQEAALAGDVCTACRLLDELVQGVTRERLTNKTDVDEVWLNYLVATRAYCSGDATTIAGLLPKVGPNREVLARMLRGLVTVGKPDYRRDYCDDD